MWCYIGRLGLTAQETGVMLVELVLVACLLKEPDHCEEFRQPFSAEMSLPQCVWQSQFAAARWAGEHPDWLVRRFSCEAPEA